MNDPHIDNVAPPPPSEPQPLASSTVYEDEALTPLQPEYATILRIEAMIVSVIFLIGAAIAEYFHFLPYGVIFGLTLLAAGLYIFRFPMRRYRARGYAMGEDRLRVVSGVMFRSDTIVPFGRVQHIDVDQGPLERSYGLATLTVHTAGSHNASVHLPGLAHDTAVAMREDIRAHIKRDTI